jgi:hypothetical protein
MGRPDSRLWLIHAIGLGAGALRFTGPVPLNPHRWFDAIRSCRQDLRFGNEFGDAERVRIEVMKRFDRAMYALFLLALLADVARSHALVAVSGDAGSGLIFRIASQPPMDAAAVPPRRAGSSVVELVRYKGSRWALARWAEILRSEAKASRSLQTPNPLLLAALVAWPAQGADASAFQPLKPASPSLGIFEHTASPAP